MDHLRGAPRPPQTHGKIERRHQTLKNRTLLENYYLPGAVEEAVAAFIDHHNNHHRYHEGLGNLVPADVYLGKAEITTSQAFRSRSGPRVPNHLTTDEWPWQRGENGSGKIASGVPITPFKTDETDCPTDWPLKPDPNNTQHVDTAQIWTTEY